MNKVLNGALVAGLAAMVVIGGSLATAGSAEAKNNWSNGNYWVKKFAGTNNFSSSNSCDWYYEKWQETGK